MDKKTRPTQLALLLVLCLSAILWFGLLTDYSWDNIWANTIYAPAVGLIGLLTWSFSKADGSDKRQRWLRRLACWLAIIGGVPYILVIVGALFTPFVLATMFWFGEQRDATLIQSAISPDGSRVAEVYFRPVGAYSGGNGRTEVHVKYTWLPFVKRDVFYKRVSYADKTTTDYLKWVDNDTLYIFETQESIKLGIVRRDLPFPLVIIVYLIWRAICYLASTLTVPP